MLKTKRNLFIILLSVLAVLCAVIGLSACDGSSAVKEIIAENYRTDFYVNDSFTTGDDFKVTAVYADGSKVDVTKSATVTYESTMDMTTAGDYLVTVSFGGKKFVYTIYVNGFNDVLLSLSADTSGMKTTYMLGDEISFEGIKLTAKYLNAQGAQVDRQYTSVADFTVTIINSEGNEGGKVFTSFGQNTVQIAKGNVHTQFKVNVEGVNISTVQSALGVVQYCTRYVNGGTAAITTRVSFGTPYTDNYQYTFGDNYTYISVTGGASGVANEYHYSIDEDSGRLYMITIEDGRMVPSNPSQGDAMNGVQFDLWYYEEQQFGIEAALNHFYELASLNANGDFTQSADVAAKKYNFSFGRLRRAGSGTTYYFETKAEFTLADNYSIATAKIEQSLYTNEGLEYAVEDGHGVAIARTPTFKYQADVTQTCGDRTAENPYPLDMLLISSFTLKSNDQVVPAGGMVSGNVKETLTLTMSDILPETASFEADLLYITDGISPATDSVMSFYGTGYAAYRTSTTSKTIVVVLKNGGIWDLTLRTKRFTVTVKVNVTGIEPTELSSEVYSDIFEGFIKGSSKTVVKNTSVKFRAVPDLYANGAYTAAITSSNASSGTLTHNTEPGNDYCTFTSSVEGTYVITMTSTVAPSVKCTFTVIVGNLPDYENALNGTYTVTDSVSTVYTFNFECKTTGDTVSGELTITKTPVQGDATQQKLNYTVAASQGDLNITLTNVSGTDMGVSLFFTGASELKMEDMYGYEYLLER